MKRMTPLKRRTLKPDWADRFDDMWFDPDSTIMNWKGLFKKQSFIEKLLGVGEWSETIEKSLKKDLANLIKHFIYSELE